jgi:hypothetical protein
VETLISADGQSAISAASHGPTKGATVHSGSMTATTTEEGGRGTPGATAATTGKAKADFLFLSGRGLAHLRGAMAGGGDEAEGDQHGPLTKETGTAGSAGTSTLPSATCATSARHRGWAAAAKAVLATKDTRMNMRTVDTVKGTDMLVFKGRLGIGLVNSAGTTISPGEPRATGAKPPSPPSI